MNRPIKFRFRYTNGTDWIFHVFTMEQILNGEPYEVLADSPLLKAYYHHGWAPFTGLKDKNGAEIYEGDVVGIENESQIWQIVWDIPTARFCFELVEKTKKVFDGRLGKMRIPVQQYKLEKMDLIGNIYEHPHLLNQ